MHPPLAAHPTCFRRNRLWFLGRWLRLFLGLTGLLALAAGPAAAQDDPAAEFRFKAAFIYHFAQFVEWPPSAFAAPSSPLVIGVLGKNPFGNALKNTVAGKSLNDHPLQVQEFTSAAEVKTQGVHILFISASERKQFPDIAKTLHDSPILTVVDLPDHFLETGFMINFIRDGQKIRFQINDTPARQAGLKISSKLLSLASRPTT